MSDLEQNPTPVDAPATTTSSPGESLRQAREKAGLSPEQVAKDLLLDTQVIRAIEVNRFKDVGAPVYAKGYLRRYARLVGVAETGVLASYDALQDVPRTVDPIPVAHGLIPAPRRYVPRWAVWLVVAAAALAGVMTVLNLRQESLVPEATSSQLPVETASEHAAAADTGTAVDTPLAQAVANGTLPAAGATETTTTSEPATMTAAPVTLQLRFSGESWVEVYGANNQTLLYDMGSPTAPREVSGTPPWRVTLGSASAVQITINGQRRDIPADKVQANVAHFVVNAAGAIE